MLSIGADDLRQIGGLLLHEVLYGMQLVPELALNLTHVRPSVHLIRLNVLDLFLCVLLLFLVAFIKLNLISLLWTLDDYLCDFLWSLDLGDLHLVLEPLLNDLCNRHVVDLLLRV